MEFLTHSLQNIPIGMLRAFLASAHYGTRGQAARALGCNEPVISRHITNLEHLLDVRLFNRQPPHKLQLTPQGLLLYDATKEAFRILGEAGCEINNQKVEQINKRLRIYGFNPYGTSFLTNVNAKFLQEHQETTLVTNTTSRIPEFEIEGVDALIWPIQEPLWRAQCLELVEYTSGIYANRFYLEEFGAPTTLEDLTYHYLISSRSTLENCNYSFQWLEDILKEQKISVKNIIETNDPQLAIQHCMEGIGISTYANELAPFSKGELTRILPDIEGPRIKLYFCFSMKNKDHPLLLPYYQALRRELAIKPESLAAVS